MGSYLFPLGVVAALALMAPAAAPAIRRMTGGPRRRIVEELAAKWGPVWGIPSRWIVVIAKIESAWRPDATNLTGGDLARGGAYGLMQMTLKTAQGLAPAIRASAQLKPKAAADAIAAVLQKYNGTGASLLDPDVNVCFGAFLLARNAREFGGSFEWAAMAYNRGLAGARKIAAAKKPAASVPYVARAVATDKAIG